jgi:phosphoglucosamine mutase
MGLIASNWARDGRLYNKKLAATVMSNLGLERHLKAEGIDLVRTAVGDRYVVEAMKKDGIQIGGEQSGHIILGEHCTTGDGIIAALEVLSGLAQNKDQKASSLCRVFETVPQLLKNVRVQDKSVMTEPALTSYIETLEKTLNGEGRILVRASGTEPLIRVMGEAIDEEKISTIVNQISAKIVELDTLQDTPAHKKALA